MGFFNVQKDASVETIMQYAQLYPGDEAFQYHNEVYDPLKNSEHAPNDRFLQRKLFALNKGKKGSEHNVKGEKLGWIDYGPVELDTDVLAEVTVPVGRLTLSREVVTLSIKDVKTACLKAFNPKTTTQYY